MLHILINTAVLVPVLTSIPPLAVVSLVSVLAYLIDQKALHVRIGAHTRFGGARAVTTSTTSGCCCNADCLIVLVVETLSY